MDDETPLFSEALKTALLSGCNLIDTSTNYADGRSERMVGKALAELIKVGVLDRNQVVLVSKVGYVQGQALELAQQREAKGTPFPDMVKYQDGCWHCIHPDFLKAQLERSLVRLGVDCIDFYLLHNPEYYLMDAAKRGSSVLLPKLRDQFYDRIRGAFAFLEGEVAKGTIRGYGVSSNTFGAPMTRADSVSLSRVWETAQSVQKENHFFVAQLPLNLFEHGPATQKNTGENQTALEFALKHDIAVLVNRPLNAFTAQTLIRLADFPVDPEMEKAAAILPDLDDLEKEFSKKFTGQIKASDGTAVASQLFHWASDLDQIKDIPLGADRWSQVEDQVHAHVNYLFEQITMQLKSPQWTDWRDRYAAELRATLEAFRNEAHARSQKASEKIREQLDPLLPESWKEAPLSRKALGVLIHTKGVSSVLNCMRRPDYVHDSIQAPKLPRLDEKTVDEIYSAFRA